MTSSSSSTKPPALIVNCESVFYQVLGLSLYCERGSVLSFPRRFKRISMSIGLSLIVSYAVTLIVLNLNPDTEFYVLREVAEGRVDTIVAASLVNWLVDISSATGLYAAALLTQGQFVRIINRVHAIQSQLPVGYCAPKRRHTLIGLLLAGNILICVLSIFLDALESLWYWGMLFMGAVAIMEIFSFRIISSIHLIYTTVSHVQVYYSSEDVVIHGAVSKALYHQQLEEIASLLEDFTQSNRLSLLVISGRLLMTNICLIYGTCFLYMSGLMSMYVDNVVWSMAAAVMVNFKFWLLGYYCEASVGKFISIMGSSSSSSSAVPRDNVLTRQQQQQRQQTWSSGLGGQCASAGTALQCLHYTRMSVHSFGLFAFDRKFVFMVSGGGGGGEWGVGTSK